MDIKWKNIKYSKGAKAAAVILVWLCFMSAFGSSIFLLYNQDNLASKNYFESNNFKSEFFNLVHNAVELNVKLKSEEYIKASSDKENTISNNLNRFRGIKKNLSSTVNFAYYIKNTQTQEVVTNMEGGNAIDLIKGQASALYVNRFESDPDYPMNYNIMQMLLDSPYEVNAAVIEPLKPGDKFYDGFMNYSKIKTLSQYILVLLIASLILLCIAFIYLVCVTGRREKGGKIGLSSVDKIYTDVHSFMVLIAAGISINSISGYSYNSHLRPLILVSIVLSIDVFICLSYGLSMIRQIKNKQIIKNTLIYKFFYHLKSFIKLCFNGKLFKAWTLLLLLVYGAVNCILFGVLINGRSSVAFISALLFIAFNIAAVYFGAKSLLSLSLIMGAAKEISIGNLDYSLDNSKISIAFLSFAEDIRSIQGGLKKAVADAVKGERMKTDLITNVSHDLKTPLTSIITYVDLLKKEDLSNEKADEYVTILEEKSGRLKKLIEDLVEASKASSGNLAVKAERVDLHELILQACGEYEEKIKKAELDIRINTSEKNTLVSADGKYLWRIVENLISNVLKYSMPDSRVYINITKSDSYGMLTIKNISAFPLDISPEQLTERFVRGDASRTTEGSGLGLSIAQSLTAIQGGRFKIEIDGDLFKVTVEIPLWMEM